MNNLMNQLHIPEKFEQGDNAIWQDPYIAKQLLKAHLNPYTDSASRNFTFMKKSVDFIHQIATKYSCHTILDLGCGPGLYSERLAELDYAVTGIDFSENSIRYAKEEASEQSINVTYRYENYLELKDSAEYDLGLLIYCEFGAFSPENRKRILANVWRSLKVGGKFMLDVFSVEKFIQFKEQQSWHVYEKAGFWSENAHVTLNRKRAYPNRVTLDQTVVLDNGKVTNYHMWHQFFTEEQIIEEMKDAGFRVIEMYDNLVGETSDNPAETIALLLEKID